MVLAEHNTSVSTCVAQNKNNNCTLILNYVGIIQAIYKHDFISTLSCDDYIKKVVYSSQVQFRLFDYDYQQWRTFCTGIMTDHAKWILKHYSLHIDA